MPTKKKFNFNLQDHGVAVRRGAIMSYITARHPKTGRELIYAGYNTGSYFVVVQIDVITGKCQQFDGPPGCQAPWGMIAVPDGRVIVTSTAGHVCVLDPVKKTFVAVAQGKTWFWHITLGGDGKYYLAGNGPNHLHRFDLATGHLENLGSVSPTEYALRAVFSRQDGNIYGIIGSTHPQVIAYQMATGKITKLLPKLEEKFLPWPQLGVGVDGEIYAKSDSGNLYRIADGRAKKVPEKGWPGWRRAQLADGSPVRYVDPDTFCIGEGKEARYIEVNYKPPGSGIFYLAKGPRDTVYGSTIMPLYLFRHTPKTRKTECLGRGAPDNGEAYSFGHLDGKLYYATYPSAHLLRYDPAQPWILSRTQKTNSHQKSCQCAMSKGTEMPKWDCNPELLVSLGASHCRPRAMFVDSKKRIWVGSFPEYGKYNGGLACYDTVSGKLKNNPIVLPNYSNVSLTADDEANIIYGGTDVILGSGTPSVEKEARIFAWDTKKQKLLWSIIPAPGATGVLNLHYLKGKLYGTTHQSDFFIYDLAAQKMEQLIKSPFAPARQQSLALAPDGNFYGITWMSLFRWRPDGKPQELWRVKGRSAKPYGGSLFHTGAAIIKDRLYFSHGPKVMSVRLPLEP